MKIDKKVLINQEEKKKCYVIKIKEKDSLIEDEKGKELLIEKPEVLFEEKIQEKEKDFYLVEVIFK